MHCVIETESFLSAAKQAGLTDDERHKIVKIISDDPMLGVIIPGTGGARKIRFPLGNTGKSGGVRVITYFAGEDIPVFMLDVYKKGEKVNLTASERNEFKSVMKEMAESYRENSKRRVTGLVERRS